MKNKKFIHHKIGHKHEIKPRNIVVIFLSILIGLGSLTVFGLVIPSSLSNVVQTIGRIVISTDGTDNILNRLYDFNQDGSGKIKVYLPNIDSGINKDSNRANNSGRKFLGIDLSTDSSGGSDLVFIDKDFFSSTGFWGSGIIGGTSGDNLGDHTATGNLKMAGHRITNDGDNEGILIDNVGNIILGNNNNNIETMTYSTIGGGENNKISGSPIKAAESSFIGGGDSNTITGSSDYSFIGGGYSNSINNSDDAFIGGGYSNYINNGNESTIGGGSSNNINGSYGTIPGGLNGIINHNNSFLRNGWRGGNALASQGIGTFTTRAPGGYYLYTSGTNQGIGVFINSNGNLTISGGNLTIKGFSSSGDMCVFTDLNGTLYNAACSLIGDNLGDHKATQNLQMSGYQIKRIQTDPHGIFILSDGNISIGNNRSIVGNSNYYVTIGGGFLNNIGYSYSATIGGGSGNIIGDNMNPGSFSFIGGGRKNKILSYSSVIGGGSDNEITSGVNATIGGGSNNNIKGVGATIGGGDNNTISGNFGFVGGGEFNDIYKNFGTIPGGKLGKINHEYSFLWNGQGGTGILYSQGIGSWTTKAPGGYYLFTTGTNQGVFIYNNGQIQSTSLMGSGDRCLYVDGNGLIQATACDNLSGDNLGNHSATTGLRLNNNRLSNDGGNEGIKIDNNGNIGIGTATPTTKLQVNGQIKINGGNPGSGKILTSDGSGLASRENLSSLIEYIETPAISIPINSATGINAICQQGYKIIGGGIQIQTDYGRVIRSYPSYSSLNAYRSCYAKNESIYYPTIMKCYAICMK